MVYLIVGLCCSAPNISDFLDRTDELTILTLDPRRSFEPSLLRESISLEVFKHLLAAEWVRTQRNNPLFSSTV